MNGASGGVKASRGRGRPRAEIPEAQRLVCALQAIEDILLAGEQEPLDDDLMGVMFGDVLDALRVEDEDQRVAMREKFDEVLRGNTSKDVLGLLRTVGPREASAVALGALFQRVSAPTVFRRLKEGHMRARDFAQLHKRTLQAYIDWESRTADPGEQVVLELTQREIEHVNHRLRAVSHELARDELVGGVRSRRRSARILARLRLDLRSEPVDADR